MKKNCFVFAMLMCVLSMSAQIATTNDTTNVVYVAYSDNGATITACSNIVSYISATVSGSHVRIVQSAEVSELTCGEITYDLSGQSSDGSFYLEGAYKSTVALRGLTLTNPSGPAVDIQNGKRIEVAVKRETVNTLTDGKSTALDAWKGCLQCKGHTEFKGYGVLNIYGNYAHGIWSKEYITIKNCTINVYSAIKDAINCNQYFSMESGEVNLSGFGDDGIQVSLKMDDTSVENTGDFTLINGTININLAGAGGSGIKASGTKTASTASVLNIYGATALDNISSEGNGVEIYSLSGMHTGSFSTIEDATAILQKGIYIAISAGVRQKIIIR